MDNYRWIEQYAYLPRIIEGKVVWLKPYYTKLVYREEYFEAGAGLRGTDILWDEVLVTTNPAEYILFGE